ncbi:acyltransferase [Phyllobacterium sp. 628]|uniref:acyltransferase family protein n=1 Tax=Phyllobacterium sp. 628 TaxID=2718938 RepID=UPI0016624112|nr:acyltransferase [Phyllobacterium sp. 628]QND53889.1 acyltransferase [Phyllobacterium sp. 628]
MENQQLRTRDIGLDHIRALAAFMVFSWHFLHFTNGYPVPFEGAPSVFPLALLDEGHTGVALFMTLSGYLFAKILDGRSVNYLTFLSRRALRLLPLLIIVLIAEGVRLYLAGNDVLAYLATLPYGIIEPTLPNGAWSLTVEFHFYLLLPFLLYLCRKSPGLLFAAIILAIGLRAFLFIENGTVFWPAYWTLVGRLDQFLFGILAYHYRSLFIKKHFLALAIATAFCLFYYLYDRMGGLYHMPEYPSPRPIWIIMPTIEGAFYGWIIAYYDASFRHSQGLISKFVARIGKYSYSLYLLHFFVVFRMADYVHRHIMDISNYYAGQVWALICFLALLPVAFVSYQIYEKPFMNIRTSYAKRSFNRSPQHEECR